MKLFCGEDRAGGFLNHGGGDAAQKQPFHGAEAAAAAKSCTAPWSLLTALLKSLSFRGE